MVGTLIPWIMGLIPALVAIRGMKFVKENERAIKLWLDRAVKKGDKYVVIKPGF